MQSTLCTLSRELVSDNLRSYSGCRYCCKYRICGGDLPHKRTGIIDDMFVAVLDEGSQHLYCGQALSLL